MSAPPQPPPVQSPTTEAPIDDPKAVNRARFELELEFVQALANPYYLHSLAQQNILDQPAFVNYLKYLLYWKEKDYARFLQWVRMLCCPGARFNDLFRKAIRTHCTTLSCYSTLNSELI